MSTYVITTKGTILRTVNSENRSEIDIDGELKDLTNDNTVKMLGSRTASIATIVNNDILGDFKSGRNYAEVDHDLFNDPFDNSKILGKEVIKNAKNLNVDKLKSSTKKLADDILDNFLNPVAKDATVSGVIGESLSLYHNAYGKNMNFNKPESEPITFYKSYNTFFDLDQNISGKENNEKNVEIFADEAEMLYGVPLLLNEPDKFLDELTNALESLVDMLIGAIIPITAFSVLQGLLQAAQSGPPDPLSLFGIIKTTQAEKYGKFISYVKIDPIENRILSIVFNPIIEGLVSVLNVLERLMNFPASPLPTFGNTSIDSIPVLPSFLNLLKNIVSFCIGYINYLIPGFKLETKVLSPTEFLTSLLSIITSAVTINKSRHNYNLLIRKIVKNNYFRRNIQFKAKTITNADGTVYDYDAQTWYQMSDFFHRFIGQRVAVGQKMLDILTASNSNRYNQAFAIQKMSEVPVSKGIWNGEDIPVSIGSSIIDDPNNTSQTVSIGSFNFNKSIYSITSLINAHGSANKYLDYYTKLVSQNEKINKKKEKRLSAEHVKQLEEIINSDYMPFSIHDLRTNEIFKFHAFLENYGDSFSVEWEDGGASFGRMDPIKIYKGTSRKINVDFWLVSMSNDDFDYMWWMVNRLITLIYPQWSAPKPANIENQLKAGIWDQVTGKYQGIPFSQPFTQIPTGSPVIRLRLGDIFTSNYTKKNLAKMFGFDFKNPTELDGQYRKIEMKKSIFTSITIEDLKTHTRDLKIDNLALTGFLTTGYAKFEDLSDELDGWLTNLDDDTFTSIDEYDDNFKFLYIKDETDTVIDRRLASVGLSRDFGEFYYNSTDEIDLKDINNPPDYSTEVTNNDSKYMSTGEEMKKIIYIPVHIDNDGSEQVLILLYEVNLPDTTSFQRNDTSTSTDSQNFQFCIEALSDIISGRLVGVRDAGVELFRRSKNLDAFMSATGRKQINAADEVSIAEGTENIVNNPIVKSFESTLGEGLAGTISEFAVGFERDIPWELKDGSRAPIAVKISLGMSVIHDILPGLDDKGIMRAPTYRVGGINKQLFGSSVYDELDEFSTYTNEIKKK